MDATELILAGVFWCCLAGVAYAYVAYPVLILAFSRVFGREPAPERPALTKSATSNEPLPTVDLLIAAHNEVGVIGARIENALALDYPADRFNIVIASDGSDDGTDAACAGVGGSVRVLHSPVRRGKTATIFSALSNLNAEIVVLSDANTFMDSDSLRYLARWFVDEDVGVVCGRLVLTDARTGRNADGLYWRYETFLKRCESRLGALLGANGAIYAIRRSLLVPLPSNVLVDDFVIPLRARLAGGCRIVYDADAIAREETAPDVASEFRRRSRIGTGGFQALGVLWPLLHPRWGWTAFAFWSHKVLRWIGPFFLLGALLACVPLAHERLYRTLLFAQVALYVLSAIIAAVPGSSRPMRLARVLPMFVGMNLALLVGFFRWVRGPQTGVWTRTPRVPGSPSASFPQ